MKRIFSTALAIALLLSLGGLAVLARGGGGVLAPAGSVVAAAPPARFASAVAAPVAQADTNAPAAEPNAVSAVNKLNNLALPLNVQDQVSPFTAYGLAKFVGTPVSVVTEVRRWNASSSPQSFVTCVVTAAGCLNPATNFALETYGNYMVKVTSALNPTVVSFVGGVPDAGSVHFNMAGGTPGCKLNAIVLPLDQSAVTKASELSTAIGGSSVVSQVRYWNATSSPQTWTTCIVSPAGTCLNPATDFPTKIGYPYWVCLKSNKTWP